MFRYIGNVFFVSIHDLDKLVTFETEFGNFHPNKKFTHKSNAENTILTHNPYKIRQGTCLSTDMQ